MALRVPAPTVRGRRSILRGTAWRYLLSSRALFHSALLCVYLSAAADWWHQECLACAADALGVPLAWGVASALHNMHEMSTRPSRGLARWVRRAAADALFVPFDSCDAIAQSIKTAETVEFVRCAADSTYLFLLPLNAMLAGGLSETVQLVGCVSDKSPVACTWQHTLGVMLHAALPSSADAHAYFGVVQLEKLREVLGATPPPPRPLKKPSWPQFRPTKVRRILSSFASLPSFAGTHVAERLKGAKKGWEHLRRSCRW